MFNRAPFLGEIAAAIGLDGLGQLARYRGQALAATFHQQLGRQPRAHEGDGLYLVLHQRAHQLDGFPQRTAPVAAHAPVLLITARGGFQRRGIPEHKSFRPARRAVVFHQRHLLPGYALGMLAGIGDGGRAADELRHRPIKAADAQQTAYDIGEVRAENAAVGMHFIDDDIL